MSYIIIDTQNLLNESRILRLKYPYFSGSRQARPVYPINVFQDTPYGTSITQEEKQNLEDMLTKIDEAIDNKEEDEVQTDEEVNEQSGEEDDYDL